MKLRLLFLIVLTTTIGWSQDALIQLEEIEDTTRFALLDDTTIISKIVTDYNEIQDEGFVISPNPGKNELNIKLSKKDSDLKLEVFDVLGKQIYKGLITKLESSINVSTWKSGVYLVRVSSDKTTKTKRFIKQ